MLRCPSCVTIITDTTVRRCPVCRENFKRHPPKVLGADRRMSASTSSWDLRAHAEAGKLKTRSGNGADIDLGWEHLREHSGRTAAVDHG